MFELSDDGMRFGCGGGFVTIVALIVALSMCFSLKKRVEKLESEI